MGDVNRRQFGVGLAAAGTVGFASLALAESSAKVVIVGGGPAGATVAGQLKRSGVPLEVTLVEPQVRYASCFFSNHYIGGLRSFASLTHGYDGLRALGVEVVSQRAVAIDTAAKSVRIGHGRTIAYDRLVVAPGIDFKLDRIVGYDLAATRLMPHAWTGGEQTRLLRRKLEAMPDGGVVVIAPPRNPYRCPPGPYERACAIAHYLRSAKPKSKVVILDPKMAFSKQAVFEEAFAKYYKDIIELNLTNDIDDMSVVRVDPRSGEVVTKAGLKVTAAVANIVPDQRAGEIAHRAGLAEGDWCPVHLDSFRSKKTDDVYVLGDAAVADEMPKSAYTANNQARAVAAHILADLGDGSRPAARYRNTCWSLLAPGDSVKIGADYAPGETHGKPALVPSDSFISKPGERPEVRRETYEESLAWYETLTADVFAKK